MLFITITDEVDTVMATRSRIPMAAHPDKLRKVTADLRDSLGRYWVRGELLGASVFRCGAAFESLLGCVSYRFCCACVARVKCAHASAAVIPMVAAGVIKLPSIAEQWLWLSVQRRLS